MDEEEGKPLNLSSSSGSSSATKSPPSSSKSRRSSWTKTTVFISFFVILIFSGVIFSGFDVVVFTGPLLTITTASTPAVRNASTTTKATPARTNTHYPLNCSAIPEQKCPAGYPILQEPDHDYTAVCPEYFRWIHEDLRPWRESGITREVLESNDMKWAHFRFIIYKGKPYLQSFHRAWQTRDVFTIWGLVQLLRVYPGRIPDLELIFCCEDIPVVKKENYSRPEGPKPPPLFRYCGADWSFDIPFPDWSFWGWAETNIKPWTDSLKDIEDKAAEMEWRDREPYAYWKGNPYVSHKRGELMQCRPDKDHDWNARLDVINWGKERSDGFKDSRLEDQCKHRYKIYVEGGAWSVSEKYILACDAMTLLIIPEFYDFFVRGMQPMQHYWPIRPDNKCRDIKFAVDWGNTHPWEAKDIGEAGTKFATQDLSMQNVYDYMFHALNEYAKLQRYEVTVPPDAVEICSESMACSANGLVKKFMEDSLVKAPSNALPCSLPPPYEPHELREFLDRKESISRQIGSWEAKAWENSNTKH